MSELLTSLGNPYSLSILASVTESKSNATAIASVLGISRFAADRALSRLQDDGLVIGANVGHKVYFEPTERGRIFVNALTAAGLLDESVEALRDSD